NVVAYISGRLHVMVNDGGWKEKWSVDINEGGAQNYDNIQISPDETKIYVSEGSYQFKVFDITGAELTHQINYAGGGVINNNEIILNQDTTTNLKLSKYTISSDVFGILKLGIFVSQYVVSENSVISNGGDYVVKHNLDTDESTTTNFSYAPYSYEDFTGKHLSPDGTKVVMSAKGPDYMGNGIYVLDVGTSRTVLIR
ncbi:hypothetical protein EB093_08575, partial [bacterium]|nr:hypothetical protein [bacterium]